MSRSPANQSSLDNLLTALPPLAAAAVLSEVVDDSSQSPGTRQHAARTLLNLAASPTPERTLADRVIGVLRGVAPSTMHHKTRVAAARGLLGAYGFLPSPIRSGVGAIPHDILTEAFGLVRQESRSRREHAALAAADLPGTRFLGHLVSSIKDTDAAVRHRALSELERRVAMAASTANAGVHVELCRVIANVALQGTDDPKVRRQTASCLLVLGAPGCLRARVVQPLLGNPAIISALQGAIRLTRLPVAGARAVEMLLHESLRASALDRLTRLEEPAERDAALSRWHLLVRPARRRVVRAMKAQQLTIGEPESSSGAMVRIGSKGLLPAAAEVSGLSRDAQAGAAAISLVVHADAPVREALAQRMLGIQDPAVRLLARGMTPIRGLPDFLFDADESVARGAAMRWLDAQRSARSKTSESVLRVIDAMRRSPHVSVRSMAMQWQVAQQQSESNVVQLRSMLRSDAATQTRAIKAIGNQEQLAACGPMLSEIASSDNADARVRASAISVLGRMKDEDSALSLVRVLEHAHEQTVEPRIIANTLDALCKRVRKQTATVRRELIAEFKQAPSAARVRASAIRLHAAIAPTDPEVAQQTQSMLIDPRPDHRLSGVWLAGRLAPEISGGVEARESWERELDHLALRGSNARTRARACQSLLRIRSAARAMPHRGVGLGQLDGAPMVHAREEAA